MQINLPFPGLDPVPLPAETPPAPVEPQATPEPFADERQIDLFSDAAVLARDIQHAIAAGDFEAACRARSEALETYGPDGPSRGFGFLDGFGPELWSAPTAEVLATWRGAEGALPALLREQLREGVMGRLLRGHTPWAIASAHPEAVGPLTATLASLKGPAGAAEGRALVRDLLASGVALDPLDLAHDRDIADVLAEDREPAWLASLGVLRRVWPAPPVTAEEIEAFQGNPPGSDDPAAAFYRCLRVARTPGRPEAALHEARRRMRALDAGLHAASLRMA